MKSLLFSLFFILSVANAETIILTKDNSFLFRGKFDSETVSKVEYNLLNLIEGGSYFNGSIPLIKKEGPLYLIMNTPGGSIWSGLDFIDFILSQKREVKTITMFSASMGFQTVQSLGERLITRSGTLMAHKASGGFFGEFGDRNSQIDSRYNFWINRMTTLDKRAATRIGIPLEKYRALFENESWCEGQTCVDMKFADKVVDVRCDKTLLDVKNKQENFSIVWLGVSVEIKYKESLCPLIDVFDVKVSISPLATVKSGEKKDNYFQSLEMVEPTIKEQIMERLYPTRKLQMRARY